VSRSAWLRVTVVVAGLAVLITLPQVVSSYRAFQLVYVGIYFIALIGLNVLTGHNGQISLGHGAFMAIGAYTTAIAVSRWDVQELWTIPLAALVAGLAGYLFGYPALRLHGVYLALATFAVAIALPSLAKHFSGLTGGGTGISLEQPHAPFGLPWSATNWLYALTWGIGVLLFAASWLLLRGRFGRTLRAVRDSEVASASIGIDAARYKRLAFGISAAYAGVAGSLLAIAIAFVNPDTFPASLSILLLTGAVVGGLGSIVGPLLGAFFVEFVPLYAQDISTEAPTVVYGLILVLVMFVAPTGATGLVRRIGAFASRRLSLGPERLSEQTTEGADSAAPTSTGRGGFAAAADQKGA
jgi:branched-chain amino acid transport system permease protein